MKENSRHNAAGEGNTLFPVFLKLEQLRVLVVGGGKVALEKVSAICGNSPETQITLVAPEIKQEILSQAENNFLFTIQQREFEEDDLAETDIVFVAVNDRDLSERIAGLASERGLLVNVADTPDLCDFYLSSVVQKGDLKIAISTNGKSPSFAKRLKETLSDSIPDSTQETLDKLHALRSQMRGDFAEKLKAMNEATDVVSRKHDPKRYRRYRIRMGIFYALSSLSLMIAGYFVFTYVPFAAMGDSAWTAIKGIDSTILLWMLCGFTAQMIDGSLGMAYGVSTTTFLLSFGINPAVASASMHASEIFTTGTSSLVYLRYRNVNMKLFRSLLIPGALGAVAGASFVSLVGVKLAWLKPIVSVYTLVLGALILRKAVLNRKRKRKKIKRVALLATAGGFLDSVGGGGWGPIVTTSLVAGGRDLRYTIGSAHAAKFFVAVISSITFFFMIGIQHWTIILGLIVGGMVAAPLSIRLSTKISIRNGLILVGLLVIIVSLRTIISYFL